MTEVAQPQVLSWPLKRACPFSPPSEYKALREEAPISRVTLPSGMQVWAITKLKDIRTMLTDPRFSSDRHQPGFPLIAEGVEAIPGFRASLNEMDAPEHGPKRREVLGEFTLKRIQTLRPRIQQIVDEQIDVVLSSGLPVDLVSTLALPVPSLVICELLGVPVRDQSYFQTRTQAMISRTFSHDQRRQAFDELLEYFDDLVTQKEKNPADDLIGRLIQKQRAEGGVRHREIVELGFLLLSAGHETTASMISLGVVALLEHPAQLAKIIADPRKTMDAVEEIARYFTVAEAAGARVATADVELGGVLIRKGEGVIPLSSLGDRDPDAFGNPDTFDIDRGAKNHIAFGYGIHQCLGANLARLQLQIVFDTLFRRIPCLHLEGSLDEMPFKDDSEVYGLHELMVGW